MSIIIKFKAYLLRKLTNKRSVDFDLKETSNVLFMRYDRIGDMVISTPVFRELKREYPHLKVLVLASQVNKEVLQNNPYVDEVIINNKNNFFADIPSLIKLRKQKLDVCVEFDHSVVPHTILRLRIINPKKIISVTKHGRYGVPGVELLMYDYYIKKPKDTHLRDIWLETLQPFGIKPTSNLYDLFPSDRQEKVALDFLEKYQNHFKLGINLEGAVKGKKIKDIDLEKICIGIKNVHNNIQIILLTPPTKIDRINQLIENMGLSYVTSSYKTNKILDVAALIKNLDIVITPDTSISHIASTFNKPIITIHEKNQESYQLFAPTSSLNKTVFSTEKNSLVGYDIQKVISYTNQILKEISI